MFNWLKALLGIAASGSTKYQVKPAKNVLKPRPSAGRDHVDGMNEGDYHSGTHGYSPNTAYPNTEYGSGYDSQADWNEGDEQ